MKKYLVLGLCLFPIVASAAPYSIQQVTIPEDEISASEVFAHKRRFYVGGMYNFAMWSDAADESINITGKNDSSFDVVAGIRILDTFRLEANYYNLRADWDSFSMKGNTVFLNALFDARIDSNWRAFHKQIVVPYAGFGAGASWNKVENAEIEDKISPVLAAMVGMGFEFGDRFALDLGYRYVYMFSPKFDVINGLNPTAHQLRFGARVNF